MEHTHRMAATPVNKLTIEEDEVPVEIDGTVTEEGGVESDTEGDTDDEAETEADAGDDDEADEDDDEDEEDEEDAGAKPKPTETKQRKSVVVDADADDDEEEDDDPREHASRDDYLATYHPEVIYPDSSELQAKMSSYTRAEDPVIRKTRAILSKYEATSIVGMRAQQIVQGSAPLIRVPSDDPIEVAQAELKAKIIPVIVRRILPDGHEEYWRLTELRYYDM